LPDVHVRLMHRFISGPVIARLTGTHRMTVNDRLRAGTYGPTFRRGRIVYAELASVERFAGVTFTDKLIEDTCQGKTDRFIIIKTEAA
jgi:hypothetical protein